MKKEIIESFAGFVTTELKAKEQELENLYNKKEIARKNGNYELVESLNYKMRPLIERVNELEFKINFG